MNDVESKAKLKKALVTFNIALLVVFVALLVSWLMVFRPVQFSMAMSQDQYASFDLDNLPDFTNTIQSEYFVKEEGGSGINPSKKSQEQQGDDHANNESSDNLKEVDETLQKVSEILDKSVAESNSSEKQLKQGHQENADKKIEEKKDEAYIHPEIDQKIGDEKLKTENAGTKQKQDEPKISIIITNLGLNKKPTELALILPKQCALGFLPYTKTLRPLLQQAQNEGHEIYLYLPMQTSRSYENPGKYALLNNLSQEENFERLGIILNSYPRYDGVYSSFKEVFTSNREGSEFLFDYLEQKKMTFVLGKSRRNIGDSNLDDRKNLVFTSVIIDKEPNQDEIKHNLEKLVKIAKKERVALGYSQGYTITIEAINEWIPSLRERGINLVPVSELDMDDR